jgi:hypothetical protein
LALIKKNLVLKKCKIQIVQKSKFHNINKFFYTRSWSHSGHIHPLKGKKGFVSYTFWHKLYQVLTCIDMNNSTRSCFWKPVVFHAYLCIKLNKFLSAMNKTLFINCVFNSFVLNLPDVVMFQAANVLGWQTLLHWRLFNWIWTI